MSTQEIPWASTRNTACCLMTGQAAGAAAALCAQAGLAPAELDPADLQSRLRAGGVYPDP